MLPAVAVIVGILSLLFGAVGLPALFGSNLAQAQQADDAKHCATDKAKIPTPIEYLTYFNCGDLATSPQQQGHIMRHFTLIVRENTNMAVSDHNNYTAWTFNGTVPGPTMRMTEGDHVEITVINDAENKHPHSLHMHSIHPAIMDGVEQPILPGKNYTYTFIANPAGVYPYHCHVEPIETHINRGLIGMIIIDPKVPRPQMNEMVMTMNGYDLDTAAENQTFHLPDAGQVEAENSPERDNEIYTVNGKAFVYADNPINITIGQPVRIYLVNMLEFDLVNSFHLHGNMFDYYPSGTSMTPMERNDIVTLSQGDRGIIEFTPHYTGRYMFHAHQTEFTELGWMGFFNVTN